MSFMYCVRERREEGKARGRKEQSKGVVAGWQKEKEKRGGGDRRKKR